MARIFGMEMPWQQIIAPQSVNSVTSQGIVLPVFNDQVAFISGHSGNDSGAICTDGAGNVIITEAEINTEVANRSAELLRKAGTDVVILEEYDPRLANLQVDVLLSLHADSCIDASGYKAAYYTYSTIPDAEKRLLECIDTHYPAVTGLSQHANTVTHDMTEYHAFRKVAPSTPAAIIELGFLGGDQDLLRNQADVVARGVVDSILCFLTEAEPIPTEPIPTLSS
jgi:N-acetylmuramoyl-L-alanine amidase